MAIQSIWKEHFSCQTTSDCHCFTLPVLRLVTVHNKPSPPWKQVMTCWKNIARNTSRSREKSRLLLLRFYLCSLIESPATASRLRCYYRVVKRALPLTNCNKIHKDFTNPNIHLNRVSGMNHSSWFKNWFSWTVSIKRSKWFVHESD